MTGWMRDAACLGQPGLPWTTDTTELPPVIVTLMADVCAACPVLAQCRAYAAAESITGGYWAGIDRDVPDPRSGSRRVLASKTPRRVRAPAALRPVTAGSQLVLWDVA